MSWNYRDGGQGHGRTTAGSWASPSSSISSRTPYFGLHLGNGYGPTPRCRRWSEGARRRSEGGLATVGRRTEGDRKVDGRYRLQSRIQSCPAVCLRRRPARPPEGGWKVVGL